MEPAPHSIAERFFVTPRHRTGSSRRFTPNHPATFDPHAGSVVCPYRLDHMESAMSLKTVPVSSLLPPKGNPRRTVDPAQIAGLAQSIKIDGVLQNLVVHPEGDKYRVVSGKRRFLALQLLRKKKAIAGDYKVPVEVKKDLADGDALRLATVENVQREELHPLDEAESYGAQLQNGGTVEDIVEKTGLGAQTVKRRLALANLCADAKKALRKGSITLRVAEALTLGTQKQQQMLLEHPDREALDAESIRDMLLRGKPTVAMAIFPKEKYTGAFTTDLFAQDETTFFDDVDQFLTLQKEAVEELAERHRQSAAWVEVFNLHTVPWWQYREAKKKERSKAGVVINLHPSGSVEVRGGLIKHEVKEEVANETRHTPVAPKERPAFSAPLLRYVAHHKSAAVQAALLRNPRKAKEVAALMLLQGTRGGPGVKLVPHSCLSGLRAGESPSPAYNELETATAALADRLSIRKSGNGSKAHSAIDRLLSGEITETVITALGRMSDADLDGLLVVLPLLCFGQDGEAPDTEAESLFNRIAADLALNMRDWWTPETVFLSALRREQLLAIAEQCGASVRFTSMKTWSKNELVQGLARDFATAAAADAPDKQDIQTSRAWVPCLMRFPARESVAVKPTDA